MEMTRPLLKYGADGNIPNKSGSYHMWQFIDNHISYIPLYEIPSLALYYPRE